MKNEQASESQLTSLEAMNRDVEKYSAYSPNHESASTSERGLTRRGVVLAIFLNVVYTLINLYLGLNFGMGLGFGIITV